MADHSKAQDHYRMAQLLLTAARNDTGLSGDRAARDAQTHATLAVVDAVRALTEQQVQVDIENEGTFALRGIAVRPAGGAA